MAFLSPWSLSPSHRFSPFAYSPTGSFSTNGTQKRKLVPFPEVLLTSIAPPWAARIARTIANPMPVPLPLRAPRFPR